MNLTYCGGTTVLSTLGNVLEETVSIAVGLVEHWSVFI